MANVIENTISVSGNAEVLAFWQNYVIELAAFVNDDAGLHTHLWPEYDAISINLVKLTGAKRFYIQDHPTSDCLYVKSAWLPCDNYVFGLYQKLAAIDPEVVVRNLWADYIYVYLTGAFAYFSKDGVVYKKEVSIGYDDLIGYNDLPLDTMFEDGNDDYIYARNKIRNLLFDVATPEVFVP